MKITGLIVFFTTFLVSTMFQIAFADETITEEIVANSNDAKRSLKKGAHRAQEVLCMDGDLECAARKAKNRLIEAGDATSDAASELKNKID